MKFARTSRRSVQRRFRGTSPPAPRREYRYDQATVQRFDLDNSGSRAGLISTLPALFHLACATLPFCDRTVCVPRSKYLPSHNRGIPVPKEPTTIGDHLRRRRLQLRIHQSEAARQLKVSTVTLSRWERDHTYPTWDYHGIICDYLGYDPFVLCGLRDPYVNETPSRCLFETGKPRSTAQKAHLHLNSRSKNALKSSMLTPKLCTGGKLVLTSRRRNTWE
jgi:transcriptional regulator with XRE-family HTH domain